MDILQILRHDYRQFPENQTFSLYDANVYFKDPMTQFRGLRRYQKMIQFIQTWFVDTQMDLHEMKQDGNQISTRWTLSWTAPLPWKPRLAISGSSELQLNAQGLITSHVDVWDCSRLSVLMQLFRNAPAAASD
jgi:hypothetical protein